MSVALVGDSHAAQWHTALELIAEEEGWQLTTYTKSGCLWAHTEVWNGNFEGPYLPCTEWSENLTDLLLDDPPSVVVVSQSIYQHASDEIGSDLELTDGVIAAWGPLLETGTKFVVIADTPRMDLDGAQCVEQNRSNLDFRTVVLERGLERSGQQQQLQVIQNIDHPVAWVDLGPWICPGGNCYAVIGGVLTFRDAHHLTATYVTSLAPVLRQELLEAL